VKAEVSGSPSCTSAFANRPTFTRHAVFRFLQHHSPSSRTWSESRRSLPKVESPQPKNLGILVENFTPQPSEGPGL